MWPVLRVAGPNFDVDALLAEFPHVQPDTVWHRGEPSRRGPRTDSGFSIALDEAPAAAQVMAECRRAFAGFEAALATANARGAESMLDIGMTLDVPKVVARSVCFSNEDLRWLVSLGVSLEVSMYVASGDVEVEPG
jgi:hypothetical protein